MQVALVHDWLTGMRGGEKVLEEIIKLFPQARLFTLIHIPGKVSLRINALEIKTSFLQKVPFSKTKYAFLLPFMPWAIERFNLKEFDLVISSSHCVAKAVKKKPKALHVCYCHAPMRYAYDLFQAYFGRKNWLYRNFIGFLLYFIRKWDQATAKRVDYFIANSQNTARKIKKYYGRGARVINPPVDTQFFKPARQSSNDFYLIVSALVPYKRIDLAVQAFNKLGRKLVIIGSGLEEKALKRMAQGNIQFLGWQDKERIRWYYQNCRAFIFPGEEDFGITAVEAQACGKPVIAFQKGGCLETVIEGKTGHFFPEQTVEALVKAVLESDKMRFKAINCRKNASQYSQKAFREKFQSFINSGLQEFRQKKKKS